MTTVKIFRKAGLGLYRRVIKHAEEVIKDGGKIVRQYQLKEDPVMFAREVLDFMAFDVEAGRLVFPPNKGDRRFDQMGRDLVRGVYQYLPKLEA